MNAMLGIVAMVAASSGGATAATADYVQYRVKQGDTLFTLGENYFVSADSYRHVQRINRINNPRRLKINSILRIPRSLLRTAPVEAEVVAFRGPVQIINAGATQQAALRMPVTENAVIATAARGFVTLMLPDESRISLPAGTRIRIDRLRRILLTGEVSRTFRLERGTADWEVTPNTGNPFVVTTPTATTAVRGTHFRVSYDEERDVSAVGVLEGRVDVTAATSLEASADTATAVEITAGTGAAVSAQGGIRSTKLLPAPDLLRPGRLQRDPTLHFAARPVSGATGYVFEIANDAGFIDRLDRLDSNTPEAGFEGLESGTYFVRTTAVDADGIEGLSAIYSFDRSLNTVGTEPPAQQGRDFLFRWHGSGQGRAEFRFILSRDEAGEDRLVDRPGLTDSNITVSNLPSGTYFWRIWSIRFENGKYSEAVSPPQRLQIGDPS